MFEYNRLDRQTGIVHSFRVRFYINVKPFIDEQKLCPSDKCLFLFTKGGRQWLLHTV